MSAPNVGPSLAKALSDQTLDTIVRTFNMREVGAPFLSLKSPMSPAPVGALRVFGGEVVKKLVTISIAVPPIGLDSHMIFAFTSETSLVPHFTLDAVLAGPEHAFHLDLIPKADLSANLAYMDAAYEPLTSCFDTASKIDGLKPANISPRQRALMSPWMLVHRANDSAFQAMGPHVREYLAHWSTLVKDGVSAPAVWGGSGAQIADRDERVRASIFSPSVDPVWAQVDRLVGPETGVTLRKVLTNRNVESGPAAS